MEPTNIVRQIGNYLVCTCGAIAYPKDRKRFNTRHPKLCSERRRLAKELADGVRCVEDGPAGGRAEFEK